ncbi:ATP-binding cassette domain-containing protein [Microbispora bryophytorum]|uniref:ABC transporter ATP-binding protein n=1 Tax=Microbispora bryophytorum TaxID=1460882 RepID=UPI00340976B0
MIEFNHVSKIYGKAKALDDVTFTVAAGSVTGFLGPNGAGKSTALRILVGLSRPSSGSATVLGLPYAGMACPGLRVGTLLDAGARHPGRTGREVLTLGAMTLGLPRTRVDEVLDLVGLTERESRRTVGGYSLGMRQRLGIAHALLGTPEVLVLDEPANGLDPQGIHWMRRLLRDLADSGCAVLLSSHLLHEVEQVADHIVMIGRGRVLAQGTTGELGRGRGLEETFLELTAHADRSPDSTASPGSTASQEIGASPETGAGRGGA